MEARQSKEGEDSDTEPAIGFVWLGTMGGRIAGRLLAAGNVVYGTNRTRSEADPLVKRGLIWRDTPRAVAEEAEVVFSMVSDAAALREITGGPDGILAGLRPGTVYVDMSPVDPMTSHEVADRVQELDGVKLEAPIAGGVSDAEEGSLAIAVGGNAAAFAHVEPLLRQLGDAVAYVGGIGEALWIRSQHQP